MYFRKYWKKILFISLLFIIFLGRYEYKMPKRNFADFHVNYYTGQKMLKGQDVYDEDSYRKDGMANFKYPPLIATITALFALTSEKTAATIWFIFNYFLIILFMFYAGKMIFNNYLTFGQRNWVYFLSLFLTSRFYMRNFDEGQVNILMMVTLFLGVYIYSKNKNFLGGLLIAFSILVKYMGFVFVPYFLFKKKFNLVFYILASLVLFSFLPALFWGWERNLFLQRQFLPHLTKTSMDIYSLSDYANQSLMAMIIRLFSSYGGYGKNIMNLNDYYLVFLVASSFVFLYFFILLPKKNGKFNTSVEFVNNIDIAMLLICAALFNPNAWIHAFIFLTYGYMVILFYLFRVRFSDGFVFVFLVLSFVLHSFTGAFFTTILAGNIFKMLSLVTFGAILLFAGLIKIKFFPHRIIEK